MKTTTTRTTEKAEQIGSIISGTISIIMCGFFAFGIYTLIINLIF